MTNAPSREDVEALIARLLNIGASSLGPWPLAKEAADALTSLLARISEVEKALEPFGTFIDGNAAKALPDDWPLTNGSPMAKRQVTVGDFRRARAAIHPKGT